MDLSNDHLAKKLATTIYEALHKQSPSEGITMRSFYPYFKSNYIAAKEAFSLFDKDGNGTIDLFEMQSVIMAIYRDKRDLNASLNDLSNALGQLNLILYGFSIFVTFIFALPTFGVSLTSIIPFSTFFVGLSFIFGGSAKTTFDCIIFIFVNHPFDSGMLLSNYIGDLVTIDGINYQVQELSLLVTTFQLDGKLVYIPNSILSNKPIINIRRSSDLTDFIMIVVEFATPEEIIKKLHDNLCELVKNHPSRFKGTGTMDMIEIGADGKVTYRFSLRHKGNWQNGAMRWSSRTFFMFALKRNMEELGIKFAVLQA